MLSSEVFSKRLEWCELRSGGRYRPINSQVVFSNSRYSNESTNFDIFDLFKSIDCFGGPAFDFPDGLCGCSGCSVV